MPYIQCHQVPINKDVEKGHPWRKRSIKIQISENDRHIVDYKQLWKKWIHSKCKFNLITNFRRDSSPGIM